MNFLSCVIVVGVPLGPVNVPGFSAALAVVVGMHFLHGIDFSLFGSTIVALVLFSGLFCCLFHDVFCFGMGLLI